METKVALVTGSSRGIGKGIALCLAKRGWNVAINFVSSEKAAEETQSECESMGVKAMLIKADIADTSAHERIIGEIHGKLGRLDLLVNNAGVAPKERKDILESGEESFDRLIHTNLRGPYFLVQKAARYFIAQQGKIPDFKGMIINITSISSYTSSPMRGEYCVSKSGLSMVTTLYADRLAEYGIPVYEIRPGIIRTDMTSGVTSKYDALIAQGLTPIRRWGVPEDIGKAVVGLASDYFPFSTGEIINVDGGFHLRRL